METPPIKQPAKASSFRGPFVLSAYFGAVGFVLLLLFVLNRQAGHGSVRGFGVAGSEMLMAPLLLAPPVLFVALTVSYLVPAFHRTKRRARIIGTTLGFLLPLPLFIVVQLIFGFC